MGTKGVTQAGIETALVGRGRNTDFMSVLRQMNRVTMQHFVTSRLQKTNKKQTPKHFYLRPLIDVNHMAKSRREMVHLIRRQGASANEWLNFCVVIGPCDFWLFCTITKRVFLRTFSRYVFSFFPPMHLVCLWGNDRVERAICSDAE